MKIHFALLFLMLTSMALAQESTPTPFATILPGQWKTSEVPWDDWFKKNTLVTDKGDYVHFFWNAQDARANFEGKERKNRLADSALEMAAKLQPATATADLCKVDIVFVLERDSYGMPKWDSLQRVVHYEFSRAAALKKMKKSGSWTEAGMKKIFKACQFF